MKLGIDILKKIACGAEVISKSEKGIEFSRFNKAEQDVYSTSAIESRTHSPAGVQLRFKTDGNKINIKLEAEKCLDRSFFCLDIICNGSYVGGVKNFEDEQMTGFYSWSKYPLGCYEGSAELGEGEKEIRIVMPYSVRIYIKDIELEGATYVTEVKKDKSILMYGDSITHGYDSAHPLNAYSVKLAEALDCECFIKAVGGEKFFPELANAEQKREYKYITVACGTNDWSSRNKDEFDKGSREFINILSKKHPNSKIFVISPVWRKDNVAQTKTDTDFDDIHYVERHLREICKDYENVSFIRGWDLIPEDENLYGDLRLHPNDAGFDYYYKNLFAKIKNFI